MKYTYNIGDTVEGMLDDSNDDNYDPEMRGVSGNLWNAREGRKNVGGKTWKD